MFLKNKWLKLYWKLMRVARCRLNEGSSAEYYEKHHIIPRSLGGGNNKTNIAILLPSEHYVAHFYLTQITSGEPLIKMIHAWQFLKSTLPEKDTLFENSHKYEELKKKLSEHLKEKYKGDKNPNAKPIIQMDIMGKVIHKWDCIQYAIDKYPGSDIAAACRGDQKTAAGFVWRFQDQSLKDNSSELFAPIIDMRKGKYNSKSRKIYQIDRTTKKILTAWDTITEASIKTGVNINGIVACCQGSRLSSGGYIWMYVEDWSPKIREKMLTKNYTQKSENCHRSKSVVRLDRNNNVLEEFNSITDAKKKYSGDIGACCRGKTKSASGHFWKFK